MKKKIFLALAFCLFLGTSKVSAATVKSYFPDENLFNCVVTATIDETTNEPTLTETTDEADFDFNSITELSCGSKEITSVTGIEKLAELKKIVLSDNALTSIDVSKNTKLEYLNVFNNKLTEIDLSKNINLIHLNLNRNQFTTVDLSKNVKLEYLNLSENKLTEVDLTNLNQLTFLGLGRNELKSLNVSNLVNLETLGFARNQLTSIDLSKNTQLTTLAVSENPFQKNIELNVGGEYNYSDYIKMPSNFEVVYSVDGDAVELSNSKIVAKKAGKAIVTIVIKNTLLGTNINSEKGDSIFESTVTVVDNKKTSDTTENPKTGVYGGSIVVIVCAVGAYIFVKNKFVFMK